MLHFRFADINDADLYYEWSNDPLVRSFSYNQDKIDYDTHVKWFRSKLEKGNTFFYLFMNEKNEKVGQVRIEKGADENIIGISIDKNFRSRSLGTPMLQMACKDFLERFPGEEVTAYIKKENIASYRIFLNAGFEGNEEVLVHNTQSYRLKYTLKENERYQNR